MTAKEKAQELLDNFFIIQQQIKWTENEYYLTKCEKLNEEIEDEANHYWKELAKKSALIAVDEILDLDLHDVGDYRNDQSSSDDFSTVTWYINYWEEVKQEIEKL
tara:strand:+ start:1240 stop:1554 length:315 start_codon:yes stop_codon:yes gene_type:complete